MTQYMVDTSRIRRELGYAEQVPFDEALRRTIEWERANPRRKSIGSSLTIPLRTNPAAQMPRKVINTLSMVKCALQQTHANISLRSH